MADSEFSSLVTESHRLRNSFPQIDWASEINERQVRSLPSLLATPNAADLVTSFLQDRYMNVLWLSNSFCVSMDNRLDGEGRMKHFITCDFRVATNESGFFFLYGLPSAELSSIVPVVDAFFQLLAWHRTLSKVLLLCNDNRFVASWPVSVSALETFVGQAKSPRVVALFGVSYSAEQCRVLAFGCNENIKLFVSGDHWMDCFSFLTEALMLNQSPRRLQITVLASLPVDSFNAFLTAVENSTSLLELGVRNWQDLNVPRRVALFRAIGRNKGLQCLDLEHAHLSDTEWKVLWEESLSQHPTIRTLCIKSTLRRGSDMHGRDKVMVRSIRTNSVLREIKYDEDEHSRNTMREEVLPILQFNRLRALVEAIKQEEDKVYRCCLFTMTLLHDKVRSRTVFRYLLLSENPDLLLQCIRTRQELLCRRSYQLTEQLDAAVDQLEAVVEEMDDCGMSRPSSVTDHALFARKRKR